MKPILKRAHKIFSYVSPMFENWMVQQSGQNWCEDCMHRIPTIILIQMESLASEHDFDTKSQWRTKNWSWIFQVTGRKFRLRGKYTSTMQDLRQFHKSIVVEGLTAGGTSDCRWRQACFFSNDELWMLHCERSKRPDHVAVYTLDPKITQNRALTFNQIGSFAIILADTMP